MAVTWRLLRLNVRVLLGAGHWVFVLPAVVSQFVMLWHAAKVSLYTPATVTRTAELLAPLLAAFVCAHLLAPEYRYQVAEIVLVRPVSFRKVVLLRLVVLYAFVAALMAVLLVLYWLAMGHRDWNRLETIAASVPSTLFLSLLAIAVAAAWKSPAAGFGAALAYWGLDMWRGPDLNPLLTLQAYSARVATGNPLWQGMYATGWLINKAALLLVCVVLAYAARAALRRPVPQRRLRSGGVSVAAFVALVAALVAVGLPIKVLGVMRLERQNPNTALLWFRQAIVPYGRVPVPYVMGPAFAGYVGYLPPWSHLPPATEGSAQRTYETAELQRVAEQYSRSPWAVRARYEWARRHLPEDLATDAAPPTGPPGPGRPGEPPPRAQEQAPEPPTEQVEVQVRLAAEYCQDIMSNDPDSVYAPGATALLAEIQEALGQTEEGLRTRRQLVERYPTSAEAWKAVEYLLDTYRAAGHQADLMWAADQQVKIAPASHLATALVDRAEIAEEQRDGAAARKDFEAALEQARGFVREGLEQLPGTQRGRARLEQEAAHQRAEAGLQRLGSASP